MTISSANSVLAMIAVLILIDVVRHMSRRTCNVVRLGVMLLFAGLMGDFLSLWLEGWGQWATTLETLGVIAFFAADRRYRKRLETLLHWRHGRFVFDAERRRTTQ